MDHKTDVKKTRLSVQSWLLIAISIVLLPICLLVPFMDHSHALKPAFSWSKNSCTTNATLLTHNQCTTWSEPHTIWPMAILFLLVLVAFGLAVNVYASRLVHRDGRRFANYRFATVLFISIVGFTAFTVMRGDSQNYDSGNFGLSPYSIAHDSNAPTDGPYVLVNQTRFGYGLTPMMVLLLIAGFVTPAFVSWHQFIYSRNYIDGQKKQELFQ